MKRRVLTSRLAWVLLVCILLSACAPAATPTPQTIIVKETQIVTVKETQEVQVVVTATPAVFRKGGTLVIGLIDRPATFDPADHRTRTAESVLRQWADPLIAFWPDSTRRLMVAESIKQIEPTVWEVRIRKGITFHNGDPLTAADIKFTFDRLIMDNAIEHPTPHTSPRKSLISPLKSVEQVDDHTVRMHLASVHPDFVSGLLTQEIVPKKYLEQVGTAGYIKQPIGTGPFKYVQGTLDGPIVLERYDGYHGGPLDVPPVGPALVDRVVFQVIPEAASRVAALLKGEIDIALAVPSHMVPQLIANPDVRVKTCAGTTVYVLHMNCGQPPFDDARVRQAMNYALDVEAIVGKVFAGYVIPLAGPLGIHNQFYDPDMKPYGYDLDKAKALLAEAGWKDSDGDKILDKDGQPFSLVIDVPTAGHRDVCEAMASELVKLGVDARVRVWESAALGDAMKAGERAMSFVGFGDARGDPYSAFDYLYQSKEAQNYSHYKNERVDELIAAGRKEADPAKRRAIYLEAQHIVRDEAPCVFAYQLVNVYGLRARVQNFEPNPTDRYDLYRVWLSD